MKYKISLIFLCLTLILFTFNNLLGQKVIRGDGKFFNIDTPKIEKAGIPEVLDISWTGHLKKPEAIEGIKPETAPALPPSYKDNALIGIKYLDTHHGLNSSYILSVFLDSRGNLWFGADNGGISKYDGSSFTYFTEKEGLNNNTVISIFEDKNGNLWFGTNGGGVSKYDGTYFTHYTKDEGMSGDYVRAILEDKEGDIWFGTNEGITKFIYDKENTNEIQSILHITQNEGLCSNDINSICIDKEGNFWFGSEDNGACRYDGNNYTYYTELEGLSGNSVYSIIQDKKGNIWFGTNGGVCKYFDGLFNHYDEHQGVSENIVFSIIEDQFGNIWCGSDGDGFFIYDGVRFSQYTEENGLSNNIIKSIIEDKNGNIWIGSDGGGVNKFIGRSFEHFSDNEGLSNSVVYAISEDKDKNLWYGTMGGGITKFDGKSYKHFNEENGFKNNYIRAITEDHLGNMWFGTIGEGIAKYDGKSFTYYTENDGLVNNEIFSILEDNNENIWVGTEGGGVSKLIIKNNEVNSIINYTEQDVLVDDVVYTIFQDSKDNIWFGTNQGVSRFNGNDFESLTTENGLGSNVIIAINEDHQGNIWFGTYGGVTLYDGENFRNLTKQEGLSNDAIYSIYEDENFNMWFGTESGLTRLIPLNKWDSLNIKVANNENNPLDFHMWNSYKIKTYGLTEGFIGNDCNYNTVLGDSKGNIWWGTGKCLTKYNPKYDFEDTIPPSVNLKSISLSFKDVNWNSYFNDIVEKNTKKAEKKSSRLLKSSDIEGISMQSITKWNSLPIGLQLPYNKNHLTFDFIGISWKNPDKVRYQFYLKGEEETWNPVTRKSEITYSNLDPGKYTLMVMATNADAYWSKPLTYEFEILPPFWETLGFRIIAIIIFSCILYFIYRWRIAALRHKQKELERIVKDRTAEVVQQNEEITAQRDEIETQKNVVVKQKDQIEKVHKNLTQSIDYAKLIQSSILPEMTGLKEKLSDYFILFKPKDKVSGDFYWWADVENHTIITAADCTGHGVPGVFMSMLGISGLRDIVEREYVTHPGVILRKLRKEIIRSLKQTGELGAQRDGMDLALISINHETNTVQYSGANNSIYIISDNDLALDKSTIREFEIEGHKKKLIELRADRMPVGIYPKMDKFTTHEFQLQKGDMIYMFSDGFADQVGNGSVYKKFMYKPFKKLILENSDKSFSEQKEILNTAFENWRGDFEQVDDLVVFGIKI